MYSSAKIVTLTDERVGLECEDGQTLTLPVSAFVGQPKIGSSVALIVAAIGSEDAGRTQISRDLLNTLLSA